MQFDELNGSSDTVVIRNESYPIRMTLQYYKSTDNGIINKEIMDQIVAQLGKSRHRADYVGSLVTDNDKNRPTQWNTNNNQAKSDKQEDGFLTSAWNRIEAAFRSQFGS